MQKVKPYIYLPIAFALVLITGIYLGSHMITSPKGKSLFRTSSGSFEKLVDVLNLIQQDYVDTLDTEQIANAAVRSILSELDPHSEFIPADQYNQVTDLLQGKFDGIGIQFRMVNDTIVVLQTIAGGPSEKVGLMAGDRIVTVDEKKVAGKGIPSDSIVGMLKGERGTEVDVSVFRRGSPKLLNFTITRDEIPTFSLDIAYMINGTTGYIKLNKFSATTAEEVHNALLQLKAQGMQKLILDLRGNSGGYLSESVKMADEFLEKGKLIVYTEGKNRPRKESYATARGEFLQGELVVLIDELSASASEIVAGAVQDNDRGTIIGRRSFGKGLVQEQLDMKDGSAIRLTVARYYTPTGRSIQKPYEAGNEQQYYREIVERYQSGEMGNADSVRLVTSSKYLTPEGDTVYGGGGIFPDIYVPLDENIPNNLAKNLIRSGMMFRFAFNYADAHRQSFDRYHEPSYFVKNYRVSSAVMKQFRSFARQNGIKASNSEFAAADKVIRTRLKAFIGRNIFDDKAFYPVIHNIDAEFQRALDYLNSESS
ncbi:MAG: S41 family peptidase [Bacteroidota bacterium]